ncbi:MAG: 50S ribosomal protein L29 [Planctomycetota bacterium]|nr:MAG: 50S ribosomal protein L29 [Planctomycetota bacterium]
MKAKELRELSIEDLNSKLEELGDLRSKYRINPDQGLKNSKEFISARKDIARVKTLLNEKRNN